MGTGLKRLMSAQVRGAAWRAALALAGVGGALLLGAALARYTLLRRRAFGEPTIRGDPGVVLSNLRFTAEDLDPPQRPAPRAGASRSERAGAAVKALRGRLPGRPSGYSRIERRPSDSSDQGLGERNGDFL